MNERRRNTSSTRPARESAPSREADAARARLAARENAAAQEKASAARRVPVALIVAAVVLLAIIVFVGRTCVQAAPIKVTVNGTEYTLRGDKNLQVAIKESGLPVNPGDFISLQGNIIERSAGYPFYAKVNDVETVDPNYQLHEGDQITLKDGEDMVEEYDAVESPIPYGMNIVGLGAFHTFEDGSDGVLETRTGRVSGEVVEKQTVDPVSAAENRADPVPGDAKVIALTFDDGPSTAYTEQILEILAANDAKATFFFRGAFVTDETADIVRKAAEEGHQICTHSYDNGAVGNDDMTLLTAEEQRNEVLDGYKALANVLGYEPSHKVRMGNVDMAEWVALNVFDLIDAEIGWTLDTGDWIYMDEDDIYDVLMSAKSGDVIRMHDGGGDQANTVAALKRALPKLVKQGYTFITVDEMMEYAG